MAPLALLRMESGFKNHAFLANPIMSVLLMLQLLAMGEEQEYFYIFVLFCFNSGMPDQSLLQAIELGYPCQLFLSFPLQQSTNVIPIQQV